MSRRSSRRYIRSKGKQPLELKEKESIIAKLQVLMQLPGKGFGFVLAFCTLLGVLVLWPRMTVTPVNATFSQDAPSEMAFNITNTGFVTLINVGPGLGFCELEVNGPPKAISNRCKGDSEFGSVVGFDPWFMKELTRDEVAQIRIGDMFEFKTMSRASIAIVITYEIWPWSPRLNKKFRFDTSIESNGKFSWRPRPIQ